MKLLCLSKIMKEDFKIQDKEDLPKECLDLLKITKTQDIKNVISFSKPQYNKVDIQRMFGYLLQYGNVEILSVFLQELDSKHQTEELLEINIHSKAYIEYLSRGGDVGIIDYLLNIRGFLLNEYTIMYLPERLGFFKHENAIKYLLKNSNQDQVLCLEDFQENIFCVSLINGLKSVYRYLIDFLNFDVKKYLEKRNYTHYFIMIQYPDEDILLDILKMYLKKEIDNPEDYEETFDYSLLAYRCCMETHQLKPIQLLCETGNKRFINYIRCSETRCPLIKKYLDKQFRKN